MTFDEICRRAAGRRRYNRDRRLAREGRIIIILKVQDDSGEVPGRVLAEAFGVHESTISRDLKFIRRVKARYRRSNPFGCEMRADSFSWIKGGRGYVTTFIYKDGVRLK